MEEEKLINMSSRMWGKEKLVWFLMWGLIPHVVRQRDELKVEIHISSTDSNSYHQSYSTWFGATPNFSTNCLCQLVKNIRFNPLFSNLWCWRWNSQPHFCFPTWLLFVLSQRGTLRPWGPGLPCGDMILGNRLGPSCGSGPGGVASGHLCVPSHNWASTTFYANTK